MRRIIQSATLLAAVAVLASPIQAADLPSVVEGQQVQAATELVFTEGPAYHADGSVFFSAIANNRIMRLAPGAADANTFLRPSGRANGLMFDAVRSKYSADVSGL